MQRTLALATAPAPQPSILIPDNADNAIRWRPGERLFDVFETTCLALEKEGKLDRIAVEAEGETLSYGALRDRVRGFAAALQARGLAPGERVGLILDRSLDSYCVMLGAIQAGLAYVPLDPKFPADRIAFIAEDANIKAFVAIDSAVELAGQSARPVIGLGALATAAAPLIANGVRPALPTERPDDELAYIIYTSGSTGRPKGVAINHSAICNFIAVAAEDYGYLPTDRVYQGLTFAFDFSIEEFWVPLAVGATLVASPSQMQLVGQALDGFLRDHRVTAMCCVPTLLATLENDLPDLRFLLVSGEACPHDLVRRWYRADRRLLNAYGPTEATVTATWTPLHPNRNVTIGVPLATYTIVLLNPEHDELAHPGDTGEIAIGGIGLAEGYVNRPELTAQKFIPDFLNLETNPSGRLYRTGDLGRIDENGEIEYLGRIDTQVKLKGYRIELGEIEEVMLEIDGIAQAVVTLREDGPTGTKDLAGYYTGFEGEGPPSREAVAQALRSRLPAYMVPAFIEPIDAIPLMPSQKADRKALPPPRHPRVTVSSRSFAAPETPTEQAIAECLGDKLGLAQVSVDDHIFDDLGLDSLAAAHVIMALDERFGDGAVSIANLYLHPTVRDLAPRIEAALATQQPRSRAPDVTPASDLAHAICGTLQGATYLVTFAAYAWFFITGLIWTAGAETAAALTGRAILVAGVLFVAPAMIAIAAKWALVGRWQPEQLKLWSLAYFRFWFVRFLVETNPVALFRGSPVFNCYLRLLGAEIGENVLLLTKTVPLATDLIRIGDNTVIRKDVHLTGYRADGDTMKIGPVDIGSSAVIGEGAVIDIGTEIGDGGQLAHASALISGQSVPPGERWHGAPATPTDADFAHPSNYMPSSRRRTLYALAELTLAIATSALGVAIMAAVFDRAFDLAAVGTADNTVVFSLSGIQWIVAAFLIAYLALIAMGLALNLALPRLLGAVLEPGASYPNYGWRFLAARLIAATGNNPFYHTLFGDSSYAVHYMAALGFEQPDMKQTGSNFGTALYQDNPAACAVGSGTMISDNLYFLNFAYGSGSFRCSPVTLGRQMFLGNKIYYPANAKIGDNCLIGSKVMVPTHGTMRSDTGLLGSPPIEIPRTTRSAIGFDPVPRDADGRAKLARKDCHNLATMAFFLAGNWLALLIGGLASYAALSIIGAVTVTSLIVSALAWMAGASVGWIVLEHLSLWRRPLKPTSCTIHDPDFWHVERHWKLSETPLKYFFKGTPFRPFVLRLLGANIGKRVFDDGSMITEKTLTRIGDDACINADVYIQAHSLEDGLFKSDRIEIGARTTLGPNSYVHYGVKTGENTQLETDAFLMKGTCTDAQSVWSGNPAAVI